MLALLLSLFQMATLSPRRSMGWCPSPKWYAPTTPPAAHMPTCSHPSMLHPRQRDCSAAAGQFVSGGTECDGAALTAEALLEV